jgi:GMP synthase-like glutamine amidotransferase
MRIHLLEHDLMDLSETNMTSWAQAKGYAIAQTYVCKNEKLPALADFDWLMVMGGSPHAWEEDSLPWLAPEKEFIAEVLDRNKIIFGVCFGAQLLAEALGGTVYQNDHEEIGWHEVALTPDGKNSFLFRDIPERFVCFHWHSDHFSLPPGCTRLAYSEPTPNQAFVMEGKPIAAVQFHPEYTPNMVSHFAHEWGHEWKPGPFVAGREAVLDQTKALPDTYWLMAAVLDNMEQKFVREK